MYLRKFLLSRLCSSFSFSFLCIIYPSASPSFSLLPLLPFSPSSFLSPLSLLSLFFSLPPIPSPLPTLSYALQIGLTRSQPTTPSKTYMACGIWTPSQVCVALWVAHRSHERRKNRLRNISKWKFRAQHLKMEISCATSQNGNFVRNISKWKFRARAHA
jgi:hypothetical protein